MKTHISPAMRKAHPDLEPLLWRTACVAKEFDNDILTHGLYVTAYKAPTPYWTGVAHPYEESTRYGVKLIHPAGRVDLRMTPGMVPRSIVILFAHELRHIGQFHRGRKKFGVMAWDNISEYEFEQDCAEFEKLVADAMMAGTHVFRGSDAPERENSLLPQ